MVLCYIGVMKIASDAKGYRCLFRPEPEGGYTVTCPKFPGVVTYGETLDAARNNAREAIELALEVFREQGREIPIPDGSSSSTVDELVFVASAAE